MNSSDLIDLIYVSELKLIRLSRALAGRKPGGTLGLEASLPLFTLKLERGRSSDSSIEVDLQATIRRLRSSHGIRRTEDRYLHGGHWFEGQADMVYGQGKWDFSPEDDGPVLFVGRDASVDVMLGGSPQHLLDREILSSSGRTGSTSERLREELQRVLEVQEGGERTARPRALCAEDLQDSLFDTFDCVSAELGERTPQARLAYIAHAHEVYDDRPTNRRVVLGTPLFVARLQPVLVPDFEPRQPATSELSTRRRWFGRARARPLPLERPLTLASPAEPGIDGAVDRPHNSPRPLDPTAPSLDVELYARPASAASYASPKEYYRANPGLRSGTVRDAVGEHHFLTEQVHWFDEQGGRWVVAFCSVRDDEKPALTSSSVGDVVATAVSDGGVGEALVLKRSVTFGEVAASLRDYRQADPMLRWVVTRLQY